MFVEKGTEGFTGCWELAMSTGKGKEKAEKKANVLGGIRPIGLIKPDLAESRKGMGVNETDQRSSL